MFINMDAPGLLILPTHRVVTGLSSFDASAMIEKAKAYFDVESMPAGLKTETALHSLQALAPARTAFVAVTAAGSFLLKANPEPIAKLLKGLSARQRSLDVVQLHKVLLEAVLGISEAEVREQSYITYLRSAEEAMQRVTEGANVAFLMNPVRMDQMRDVAFAGEVMPQKSTDFYPKLMSGLTLYALD